MKAAQEPVEPVAAESAESADGSVGSDEFVDPDEVAEEAPIDPTPQEVDAYRSLIGDEIPESDTPGEPVRAYGSGRGGTTGRRERRVPEIPEF
ncbi:hypothetical protein IOD16_24625 [Saccharothrix sp. 6-C]|uniref:hypothetical protein n=1 Tax=Saccharothrix sp. 6-C TaxID=2781735 RepID=UPI001916E22A|nr:hypothetical protein [Saccharothrix sp. 6-C]QQQ74357.1 hypothetical protein IOD16_24625 [Saccharothrix sp. 6-C]